MGKKPKLEIDVITLFPRIFEAYLNESIVKRALAGGLVKVRVHNLREFGEGRHRKCDDTPYGGGPGMVMMPEPIERALKKIRGKKKAPLYLLDPHGIPFSQERAEKLSKAERFILLCGHYEGIDERVKETLVDGEISLGDFVLTGGEVPALALIDAVVRLVPGVLGNEQSLINESFSGGILDHPHYTKPQNFRGLKVPDVLLSGNHKAIEAWRAKKRLEMTGQKRPDLLKKKI